MVRHTVAASPDPGIRIERPNRDKASSTTAKFVVVLLLLVSVGLMVVVTIGGWSTLEGVKPLDIGYIAVYLVMAFYVARWNRGVLPLAAALAIILAIFAAIAGPAWFDRDKMGFTAPPLPDSLLGLLTMLIVPVQFLLMVACAVGFRQGWNVEVEVRDDGSHVEGYSSGEPVAT